MTMRTVAIEIAELELEVTGEVTEPEPDVGILSPQMDVHKVEFEGIDITSLFLCTSLGKDINDAVHEKLKGE